MQMDLSTLHNSLSNVYLILSNIGNEITTFKKGLPKSGYFSFAILHTHFMDCKP